MSDGRGTDGERRRWREEDWAYEEGGEGSGRGGEERKGRGRRKRMEERRGRVIEKGERTRRLID